MEVIYSDSSLTSEDNTNDEHLLLFEPTVSDREMGGTTISHNYYDMADDANKVDGPSKIEIGAFHLAIMYYTCTCTLC